MEGGPKINVFCRSKVSLGQFTTQINDVEIDEGHLKETCRVPHIFVNTQTETRQTRGLPQPNLTL